MLRKFMWITEGQGADSEITITREVANLSGMLSLWQAHKKCFIGFSSLQRPREGRKVTVRNAHRATKGLSLPPRPSILLL